MRASTVFLVTSELPPDISGGLGTHVGALARGLVAAGLRVRIVLMPYYAEQAGVSFDWHGIRVDPVPFPRPYFDEGGALRLPDTLRAALAAIPLDGTDRPAVFHGHDWFGGLAAGELAARLDAPVVVTCHLMSLQELSWSDADLARRIVPPDAGARIAIAAEHAVKAIASRVVCVSTSVLDFARDVYGYDPATMRVVPNAFDPELAVDPAPDAVAALRTRLDLPPGPLIGAAGRFVSWKGFSFLLQAMQNVLPAARDTTLVIAGRGEMETYLRDEAAQYRGRVRFAGFLGKDDMRAFTRACAVGVVPSVFEPFGIAALDWMLAGTPVMVTRTGGLGDIVRDGIDGLSVPIRNGRAPFWEGERPMPDVNAMSSAIIRALKDDALRARIGPAGRERALTEFSQEKFIERTMRVYGEAAQVFDTTSSSKV